MAVSLFAAAHWLHTKTNRFFVKQQYIVSWTMACFPCRGDGSFLNFHPINALHSCSSLSFKPDTDRSKSFLHVCSRQVSTCDRPCQDQRHARLACDQSTHTMTEVHRKICALLQIQIMADQSFATVFLLNLARLPVCTNGL